ncbi:MAG: hypothetical protein HYR56_02135 [Acidobacteria bacterium]|nr:hypothetical protein [Acidobacteriota bacterium]MBI3421928.1 hypothetical protein [Acidobacteriota bacterium]
MKKQLLLFKFVLLALLLPVVQAQTIPARGAFIPLSCYRDDPFVAVADIEHLDAAKFGMDESGCLILRNKQVWVEDERVIFNTLDPIKWELEAVAWNPWPLPLANQQGDFRFPHEARFPLFTPERGPDGKIIRREGLQVWSPNNLHLGMNTAFAAANAAKDAAEAWAGRDIAWGSDGLLLIRPHFYIDFNAFHSRSAHGLFFGIVPYRLPGETDIKFYELASSWEIAAHESGHALHFALKPNSYGDDLGFSFWGESFGDQTALWASLRNPARVQQLLNETHGDLNQSSAATRMNEAFAALLGAGTALRDAFNDKKVSDTDEEIHHRSEVLTGAAYKIFLRIYDELKGALGAAEAMRQAGEIMGIIQMRATDFTPENQMTLEDVGKAYLKVDKEFFGSRYHTVLVDEFMRREIFDADSVREWQAHEAALPQLYLLPSWGDEQIAQALQANQSRLGLGPNFGLQLQSVTRANSTGGPARQTQIIVRLQLTEGRGPNAALLDNHGILVFRASGGLADYHSPLPDGGPSTPLAGDEFAQTQAWMQLRQAYQMRLDEHGVPLALVRNADGQWTVAARVPGNAGPFEWVDVFTPEHPQGERRVVGLPPVPPDTRLPSAIDISN